MQRHAAGRRRRRLLSVAVMTAGAVMWLAAPALAHVELAGSDPADGVTLQTAPAEIRLDFSAEAVIAGDGMILYDETGAEVPVTVAAESPTVVLIEPKEPIPPGQYLVSWTMQAGDAHPKSGTLTFAVAAEAAAVPQPTAPPAVENAAPTETTPAVFAALSAEPSTFVADWVGRIARTVSFAAVLLGLGSFVFATLVFEGAAREARMVGFWGRRAGLAVLLAVPLEIGSQAMLLGGGSIMAAFTPTRLIEAMAGPFGLAVLLRALGGLGLFLGTRLVTSATEVRAIGRRLEPWSQRPSGGGVATDVRETFHVAASPMALAGAAAVALSFLFDGHTAVTAPSWLVRFASVVHIAAAATWVGGVAMLAAVFTSRRRRGVPLEAARLVVPFSTVAAAAVALVGLAGAVLAVATVDAWADFFTTAWGRALLAKLALVGAAAAMGGYNHFVLMPELKRDPSVDGPASEAVAHSVRIEIVLLLCVAAVTAVLVGLAS
jgi:copper transport protein